jgi:hypothetical protein
LNNDRAHAEHEENYCWIREVEALRGHSLEISDELKSHKD